MKEKKPLPEVRVILQRLEPGEKAVELNYPENLGQRTKLGGEPDWIQGDAVPHCPSCKESMTFVVQVDSIDFTGKWEPEKPKEYMFGDVGMIYVFYCFQCGETTGTYQCY